MVQALRIATVLVSLFAAGVAAASPGAVIYVKGAAVWQLSLDPGAKPVHIADLPEGTGAVTWLEATADGKLVVVEAAGAPVWILSGGPDKQAQVRVGPCHGRARPSPKGECVICNGPDGPVLASTTRTLALALPGPLDEPAFRGPSGNDLAALTDQGLVGFDRRRPKDRTVLAKAGGQSHVLISPDGTKAVAVFGDKDASRVRSFLLDGEGVSRQLGGPGVPHLWSWDSTWVLFAEGDIPGAPEGGGDEGGWLEPQPQAAPPTFVLGAPAQRKPVRKPPPKKPPVKEGPPPATRACVARASGGEVKCWPNFAGLAFSPDSSAVLLAKDHTLYMGKIAGVHPDPPTKVVDGVDGPATWVPGPIAAEEQPAAQSRLVLP